MKKIIILSAIVFGLSFSFSNMAQAVTTYPDGCTSTTTYNGKTGEKCAPGSVLGSSTSSYGNDTYSPAYSPMPPVYSGCVISSFAANPSLIGESGSTIISWKTNGCSTVDLMGVTSTGEAWDRGINTNVNGSSVFGLPDWTFVYGNTGIYTFILRAADSNGNTTDRKIPVTINKTGCTSVSSVNCNTEISPIPPMPPVPSPDCKGANSTNDIKPCASPIIGPADYSCLFNKYSTSVGEPCSKLPPVPAKKIRTLRPGLRGDDVKALQEWLNIKADGVYGRNTALKVKEWQISHELKADGSFGPASMKKIDL